MGRHSREKGASAERELRALLEAELGPGITRNLGQCRDGGHDLEGVGPFALEVKRYAATTDALLAAWWAQAEYQAQAAGRLPALAYRTDRQPWRVVVPVFVLAATLGPWAGWPWTATLSLSAFCALVRELGATHDARRV